MEKYKLRCIELEAINKMLLQEKMMNPVLYQPQYPIIGQMPTVYHQYNQMQSFPYPLSYSQVSSTNYPVGFPENIRTEGYKMSNRFDPRKVTSKKGITVELRQKELSTLLVTTSGGVEKTWWKSDLENSHSIAISPDDRYAAFISEQNGIVIMKLPQ